MRKIIYLMICISALACSKGGGDNPLPPTPDPDAKPDVENKIPTIPQLVFPEKDQLCLDSDLNFKWVTATDPDGDAITYQIQISTNRAFTGIVEDLIVNDVNISLEMEGGQDYYWRVLAIDSKNAKSDFSPSSAFYVQGVATNNYIPFGPSLISPKLREEVNSANVILKWEGSDLDNDNLIYDIYLGMDQNPMLFEADLTTDKLEVSIESNQTYYWQVHVSDGKSKSIGEIWTFKTY